MPILTSDIRLPLRLTTWVVAALLLAIVAAPRAGAASPIVADYGFTGGSYASSVPGAPPLTDIGVGAKGTATESVRGTTQTVRTYPAGSGFGLGTPGLLGSEFTIIVAFRTLDADGYMRIIDFTDGTLDNGLYAHDNNITFYDDDDPIDSNHTSPGTPLADNTWVEVAYTRSADRRAVGYVNGAMQFNYVNLLPTDESAPMAGTARFFLDDGSENADGAIGRLRIYDRVLTAAEIATISAGGDPFVEPTSDTACPAGTSTGVVCTSRAGAAGLVITGTSGRDRIVGSSGPDIIRGLRGRDTISGRGGRDRISGGGGRDVIVGGGGPDVLKGSGGADHIDGRGGDDTIYGGPGDDLLHGDDGADHLWGDDGDDSMFGDAGDDWFWGGPGDDDMVGGPGWDVRFTGGTGADTASRKR